MTDEPPAEWSEGYDTCFMDLAQSAEHVRFEFIDELIERNNRLENRCESLRSALWVAVAIAGVFAVAALVLAAVMVRVW